jgi:hypothetical protein
MSQAFRCDVCKEFEEGSSLDELYGGVEVNGIAINIRAIFARDGESSIRPLPMIEICDSCKASALALMVATLTRADKKKAK